MLFAPDHHVQQLVPILKEQLARWLPVKVSPGVQFLVNLAPGRVYVTLINNQGVTKAPREKPAIDPSKAVAVTVSWQGGVPVKSVRDVKNHHTLELQRNTDVILTIPAGDLAVLEFRLL